MSVETIIAKLEHQKTAIANALLALRGIDNSGSKSTTLNTGTNGKRKFSHATRRKMAESQQKRWAARKDQPSPQVTTEGVPQVAPQAINRRTRKTQSRSAA